MTPTHLNASAPNGQPLAPAPITGEPPAFVDAMRRIRSQSPQESLGIAGEVGLLKPTLQATAMTAILFAALTAGPYFVSQSNPPAAKPEAAAKSDSATPTPDATPPVATPPVATSPVATSPPDATATAKTPAGQAESPVKSPAGKTDVLDKLGMSGTKDSSPKVNPLDKKDDDLLKDLK